MVIELSHIQYLAILTGTAIYCVFNVKIHLYIADPQRNNCFCILTLYPATLLYFLNCEFFLIFDIDDHVICKKRQFFCLHFQLYTFSFIIVLASTSSTVLKRNSEKGHSCLFPDLTGNVSGFSPLNMLFSVWFYFCRYSLLS